MPRSNKNAFIARLKSDTSGVSTIQYGFLLGLVAIGSLSALKSLGSENKKEYNSVTSAVAANQVNADPFAGAPGTLDTSTNKSTNSNTSTNTTTPTTSSGGAYEPAAMQAAPPISNGGAYEVAPAEKAPPAPPPP